MLSIKNVSVFTRDSRNTSISNNALELAKKLSEQEKRIIEEFKEMRGYYYLGYIPVVYRIKVNV
jgi:hypothetical protein